MVVNQQTEPELITVSEAAHRLGMRAAEVEQLIAECRVTRYRIGRQVLLSAAEVEQRRIAATSRLAGSPRPPLLTCEVSA